MRSTGSRCCTSPIAPSSCTWAGSSRSSSKVPLKTRDDLSMAYTPGVARICRAVADSPEAAWNLTIKSNTVAVVSDGTAVLGLGDIGPEAAMPVMEGKAVLFKEFGGIDAWPICLATTDVDEIVDHRAVDRAGLRRHQPRGHLGPALLRDRAPPARRARHPGLPRRPARHGHRHAGGARQRAQDRRQAARGRQDRHHRSGRGRDRDERPARRRGRAERDRLRPRRSRAPGSAGSRPGEARVCRADEPGGGAGRSGRRAGGSRRLHRAVRPRRDLGRRRAPHGEGRRSCSPWPTPRPRCRRRRSATSWR